MAATQDERLPEQFGRYRIIQRLGQGGMGSVFLAEDTQLGRRVALKVSDLRNSPEGLKRFEREARALAALDHPYICHVYDFGNHDGIPFLVMAHIAGASLAESLPEAGLPPRQAAALVGKLAVAMQEAHAQDILHRDLKPSNVMMKPTSTGPVPIIVDFGLARGSGSAVEALTGTGQAIGTLPYMPLEQINGDKTIGPACDIYALGVILYELLTGEKPFDGPFSSIIAQKLTPKPKPLSALRPGLDPRLDAICLKAMAKDVKDRHVSMGALAAALTEFLKPTPAPPRAAPVLETTLLPVRPLTRDERTEPLIPPPRRPEPPKPPSPRPSSGPSARPVPPPLPIPQASRSSGRPPRKPLIVLGTLFGGLTLLGIIIYVTTDKGEVKIDLATGKPSASAPLKELTSPFTKMKLALIPAGSFEMGSPDDDKDAQSNEKPRHRVTISRPFYLGVHEVTQGEYQRMMGANPSRFKGSDSLPVETVTWFNAVKFCNALSEKEGLAPFYKIVGADQVTVPDWNGPGYRLPTEAEWEYACRAGSTTRYSFGDDEASLIKYAWYGNNSDNRTHPVGRKLANAFGLYDMHGNVWEWCWDWYDSDQYNNESINIDPKGPETGDARVLRGGGWLRDATDLRSACRHGFAPAPLNGGICLRLARTYH